MIFDDVGAKEPAINKHFRRGRHNKFNMIHLYRNLFTIDTQNVRENCNLFIFFEQRGKVLTSLYQNFFSNGKVCYTDFSSICNKVLKEPYNNISLIYLKNKNVNGKLRVIWDWSVL